MVRPDSSTDLSSLRSALYQRHDPRCLQQESATHEAQPSVTDILGIPLNTLASPGDSNVEAKGWVESFPFERSSAFHQRQTAEVLRMNLPDRSQAEELCRLFFKNRE